MPTNTTQRARQRHSPAHHVLLLLGDADIVVGEEVVRRQDGPQLLQLHLPLVPADLGQQLHLGVHVAEVVHLCPRSRPCLPSLAAGGQQERTAAGVERQNVPRGEKFWPTERRESGWDGPDAEGK